MKLTKEQKEIARQIFSSNPSIERMLRTWDGKHGRCPFGVCRGSLLCEILCDKLFPGRPITRCPCEHIGNSNVVGLKDEWFNDPQKR